MLLWGSRGIRYTVTGTTWPNKVAAAPCSETAGAKKLKKFMETCFVAHYYACKFGLDRIKNWRRYSTKRRCNRDNGKCGNCNISAYADTTIIGSINLGSHINEYRTGVARFQHAVSHRRSVRRQPFAPMSLFFVASDAYSQSFSEFFSVDNVNSFSSVKRIKITSFGNSFEQKGLAWRFVSISVVQKAYL